MILNLFEFIGFYKKSPTFVEDLNRGEDGIYLDSAKASLDINFSPKTL